MSQEFHDDVYNQIREVISRLQSPIEELSLLYSLLAAPLAYLKILPPKYLRYNPSAIPDGGFNLSKHVPALQRALLEHVLPTWAAVLDEEGSYEIVQQYFAPDLFMFAVPSAKEIAVYAYATILSLPLTEQSIRLLLLLTKTYSVDVLWDVAVLARTNTGPHKHTIPWEDCVKNIAAIPGRIANAYGGHLSGTVPHELEFGNYFTSLSVRYAWSSAGYLLTKLVNIGIFPSTAPVAPAQPSFFAANLDTIRLKLQSTPSYAKTWNTLLSSLSSPTTLRAIINSFFAHLAAIADMDGLSATRALVKREALLLQAMLGPAAKDTDVLDCALAGMVGRQWSIGHARVFVCWAAGADTGKPNSQGMFLITVAPYA
ncbi:hypothetical protein EIP86_000496 [Pleurotus ostreatoroseus]|nr:hypothetical protein EIP86_000496 [Pleurotus ostreatoroseus]